jgi:plastocyanin
MQHTIVKHEVKIEAVGEYAVATPKTLDATLGDTVQFGTSQKAFRVVFKPWPFKTPAPPANEVTTSEPLTLEREGSFEFLCYVTPNGATKELEYKLGSGGNGNVTRP